jgi:hypothetical protein
VIIASVLIAFSAKPFRILFPPGVLILRDRLWRWRSGRRWRSGYRGFLRSFRESLIWESRRIDISQKTALGGDINIAFWLYAMPPDLQVIEIATDSPMDGGSL